MPKSERPIVQGESSIGAINLKRLAELVPAMIAIYDIDTGEYIYVNQSIKRILDYSPDDFTGKGLKFVASLVHPDDLPLITEKNQAALEVANSKRGSDSDPIISFEHRIRHKNGRWVWLHTDGLVYSRNASGKVDQVVNVSIDITKRKKDEEKLRRLTKQLFALNTSKDEFVAITSHQLRTPATAVKQYLGLLLEGYSDPLTEGQRTFLQLAYENNERQLHIVDEILKITQLDLDKIRLKLEPTNVSKVVEDALDALHSNFKRKNQRIFIRKPKEPIILEVDRTQMRTAFENLLENASNYSEEGKNIKADVKIGKNEILIEIKDEGVGINPDDFPKLFQKFSRIPNSLSVVAGGTGLGLYWTQRIIQLHKGRISVDSKAGAGTSFIVRLPIKQ